MPRVSMVKRLVSMRCKGFNPWVYLVRWESTYASFFSVGSSYNFFILHSFCVRGYI